MKLTLESAVDFSKANAMSMKHHFDNEHEDFDLNPIITFYSKETDAPLFQVILPSDAMHEDNKRVAYMMATSVASFIDADYITMVNDVYMSKQDAEGKSKDDVLNSEDYVRPSEDINSTEALMIIGMSKDRGLVVTQSYGRDDIGKMYYKDCITDEFNYTSVNDEELDRGWMTRIGASSLTGMGMDTLGITDDSNAKIGLLFEAMHQMDNLDFMVAYTNHFGDYMYDKFYSDELDDKAKEILNMFQTQEGFFGEKDNE